jgi:hypothetical protein
MATCGTVSCYRSGCRCANCRKAEAQRKRRNRAQSPKARLKIASTTVTAIPERTVSTAAPADAGIGEVELGVRAQIERSAKAEAMPGVAAGAIKLAKLLDRDDHSLLAPQLYGKLDVALARLDGPAKKLKSRLVAVQSMTNVKRAASE